MVLTGINRAILWLLLIVSTIAGLTRSVSSFGAEAVRNQYEVFVDEFFNQYSATALLPGAVAVVIKDGRVELLKGYGFADIDKKTPMSPEETAVRVASTSKLFTVTAVMQLVEKGVLDLDTDISAYLPQLDLKSRINSPITLRHLLTHTAGLDEVYVNLVAHRRKELMPLLEYVKATLPAQVFRPGVMISYSNHGFALAGLIVEVMTKMPFNEYMQKHVLKPLGMDSSSFEAGLALEKRIAKGYEIQGDKLGHVPLDYIQTGPASSLVTTASDISNFLMAQLEGGRWNGHQILRSETVAEMHKRQFSNDPRLPGFGLGFYENFINGQRIIVHGGEARGWNTLTALIPQQRLGLFFCYNRFGPDTALAFLKEFVQTFYPQKVEPSTPAEELPKFASRKDGEAFKGFYRLNRYPHASFTAVGALIGGLAPEYFVSVQPSGYLRIFTYPWIKPINSRWHPVGENLFKAHDTGELMAFRDNESGDGTKEKEMKYLFRETKPEGTWQRIHWFEAFALHMILVVVAIMVFIFAFGRGLILRERKQWLATVVSAANLLFVIMLGIYFSREHPVELAYGIPLFIRITLALPIVSAVATLGLYGQILKPFLLAVAGNAVGHIRIGFSLIVGFASLIFLAVLHYWNFIGYRM